MTYILDDDAGVKSLRIKGELHKYLVKVRRHKESDEIAFRSRKDMRLLHTYRLEVIEPKSADLTLIESKEHEVRSPISLHVAWCIIDSNSIEKVLASLCEIGVERISFIYCDRSQKNFKPDIDRFTRILEASMQQCGRSTYIEFDTYKSIKEFIAEFPDTAVFDFCQTTFEEFQNVKRVLIGCEGGFSQNERDLMSSQKCYRLSTPMILRSESAVLAISSKILL